MRRGSSMEHLREQLLGLRVENNASRYFVPNGELEKITTKDMVRTIIRSCNLDECDRPEILDVIFTGAQKILGILILIDKPHLITKFIEKDNYRASQLDSWLPLSKSTLEPIIHKSTQDFWEKQWEFLAPTFSNQQVHRSLDKEIILPFISKEYIDEGGFGDVYKIEVHPSHVSGSSGDLNTVL